MDTESGHAGCRTGQPPEERVWLSQDAGTGTSPRVLSGKASQSKAKGEL